MTLDIPLNLETPVFPSIEEQNFLHEWIKTNNDNVKIKFILREKFSEFSWDFLKDSWNWKKTLYLPIDLKHWELPAIIKKINSLTPNVANQSTEEVWFAIKMAISRTIQLKSKLTTNETDCKKAKDYEKAIKKYIALYQSYFPDGKITTFSDPDFVEKLALEAKKREYHQSLDYEKRYKDALQTVKTEEELDRQNNLVDQMFSSSQDIDSALARELWINLTTAIAEVWKENVLDNLKTVTKKDYQDTIDKAKKEWKVIKKEWNITKIFEVWANTEIIKLNEDINKLDKNERFLKDAVRLDEYKSKLEFARTKTGADFNIAEISKIEKEFVNLLLKKVYEYERNISKDESTSKFSSPNNIVKDKKAICTWKTFISESFLEKLWIKHNTLEQPWHSSISIMFSNNEEYYFDPTNRNDLWKITYWKNNNWWYYDLVKIDWITTLDSKLFVELLRRENERWNINQIIWNNWSYLSKQKKNSEAIDGYKKALLLNPDSIYILNNLWVSLQKSWKNSEAIDIYNKMLTLNPKDPIVFNNLWTLFSKKWDHAEALKYFENSLNLTPYESLKWSTQLGNYCKELILLDDYDKFNILVSDSTKSIFFEQKFFNSVANAFLEKWKFEESLKYVNKAIEIEPNNKYYLDTKWEIYLKIWDYKQSREYYNRALAIDPNYESSKKWIAELDKLEGKKK